MGDPNPENRKRKSEANQLRRSIFGRKHDRLGESKVCTTASHPILICYPSLSSY